MSMKLTLIVGSEYDEKYRVMQSLLLKDENVLKGRKDVLDILNRESISIIHQLESNEALNPTPADAPCCKQFETWTSDALMSIETHFNRCPYCGKEITEERRNRYLKGV